MRTIESPGVEINEIDLSLISELPVGTVIFCAGYTNFGPIDELINLTSISEFESIYGLPTNSAERYFYNTCKQILLTRGVLLTTRIPYGSGSGDGYTVNYSALAYPAFATTLDPSTLLLEGSAIQTKTFDIPFNKSFCLPLTTVPLNSGVETEYIYPIKSSLSGNFTGIDSPPFGGPINFDFVVSGTDVNLLSCSNANYYGTVAYNFDNTKATINILNTNSKYIRGNLDLSIQYVSATAYNEVSLQNANSIYIGEPQHFTITKETYDDWNSGNISWKSNARGETDEVSALSGIGFSSFIIVNKSKSTINEQFAGYYIAIADNSKTAKSSNYDVISNVKSFNSDSNEDEWIDLSTDKLAFKLSGTFSKNSGSISEIIENVPSFNFSNDSKNGYTDSLIISLFKLRQSLYNSEDRILESVLSETYVGSLDETRTIQNERGGAPLNFYIEDIINDNSRSMTMFVNPYISKSDRSGAWFDGDGNPIKRVRVKCDQRNNLIEGTNTGSTIPTDPAQPGGPDLVLYNMCESPKLNNADNLYGIGEYVSCRQSNAKNIGNLPYKLERSLTLIENRDLIRVDIVPEAGLGTIWTGMSLDMNNWPANATDSVTFDKTSEIFDDNVYISGILNAHTFDQDSKGLLDQETGASSEANDLYETIFNIFNSFASTVRKDFLYIADPLRYIFVQGPGVRKVLDDKSKNFSQHIYWPLKNQFGAGNSSYACTYANWFKITDTASGKFFWMPPSGYMTRQMIETDTNFFPWYAPAGLTRGIIRDIIDIGINPSQRQRDLLYKVGINPIVYWPGDGYVVWGQKTLLQKPSAFNRINVRRLFLWLEKASLKLARYFVFEQNTVFTRERLKTTLRPIFEFAKNNEGIYDYLIVCDERNNTPDVIDRNELVVDIYIKAVRVAEYILLNFIATRTDANFEELI